MNEIRIQVLLPDEPAKNYVFSSFPVSIGRSLSCSLSICHAAIPRELCSIWPESDSNVIHLEEKPNLTNPLLFKGRPVQGGITRRHLSVQTGPVKIRIRPGTVEEPPTDKRYSRLGKKPILVLFTLIAIGATTVSLSPSQTGTRTPRLSDFPSIPVCSPPSKPMSEEKARIAVERAIELLSRRPVTLEQRQQARRLLCDAASGFEAGNPARASEIRYRAEELQTEMKTEYQMEVLRLIRFVDGTAPVERVSRQARTVLSYLNDDSSPIHAYLKRLAGEAR